MASKNDSVFTTAEAARAEIEYLVKVGEEKRRAEETPTVLSIDGHSYTAFRGNLSRVQTVKPDREEKPDVFEAFSLSGLVDYIMADVDGLFQDPAVRHIVRVIDPKHVEVLSPLHGFYKERDVVARCSALTPKIAFGTFLGVDEFQIMVQAMFTESVNRALVLQLSGSLRKEQSMQTADDGVSQKITINRGVSTADDVTVRNPVPLRPLRTFYEVEQPESPFILRFNEDCEAALFEGDGGAWQLRAVENVRKWLAEKLSGCNVEIIA